MPVLQKAVSADSLLGEGKKDLFVTSNLLSLERERLRRLDLRPRLLVTLLPDEEDEDEEEEEDERRRCFLFLLLRLSSSLSEEYRPILAECRLAEQQRGSDEKT